MTSSTPGRPTSRRRPPPAGSEASLLRDASRRPSLAAWRGALAALAVAAVVACGGAGTSATPTEAPPTGQPDRSQQFRNPVIDADFPDPTVLRAPDGWFYAYATQTVRGGRQVNIQVARSLDLVLWNRLGDALPQRPRWSTRVWAFWAPHVVYGAAERRYFMYYSAHHDGIDGKCLAVATADAPDGPFVDTGEPLACAPDGYNIDPMAFEDPVSGRRYLYWGSSDRQPIQVQELAADRVSFAPGSTPRPLVPPRLDREYANLVEAAWVIHRDGWYYLFYSGDDCCGSPPHYAVLVARARSPLGPFERLGAVDGTQRSEILSQRGSWIAPGHNAVITDDAGVDWIVYHAVDPTKPRQDEVNFVRRPMLIDRLSYRNGWPTVDGGMPSSQFTARPTFAPR